MTKIKVTHKFLTHEIDPSTETLIIGTFNPNSKENNETDFYYGRGRNFLWTLLPKAFNLDLNLKGKPKNEKLNFILNQKIGFIDLISSVNMDEDQTGNYKDSYLDGMEIEWRDVVSEIEKLPHIKRVAFTRKSDTDIPNMKVRIEEIEKFCAEHKIKCIRLTTPARFYNDKKQDEWNSFFQN